MTEKRLILTMEQLEELASPPPGAARFALLVTGAALVIGFVAGLVVGLVL